MHTPLPSAVEVRRLVALAEYRILDTEPETPFDDLTRLAAQLCSAPIALISLIGAERQWCKSRLGLDAAETSRAISFCSHPIEELDLLMVPDALSDSRFAENPFVTGGPHVRSCAGAPLRTADGYALGTLCVFDRVPRAFSPAQQEALRILSRQVMAQLELRRTLRSVAASEQLYRSLFTTVAEGVVLQDASGRITAWNPAAERILGLTAEDIMGRSSLDPRWRTIREDKAPFPGDEHPAMVALRTGAAQTSVMMGVHRPDGSLVWISINAEPVFQEGASEPTSVVCSFADVTARKKAEADLHASQSILIQQERLRAFGQLASGVAHDMNNAICPVSIYAKVLLKTERELSPRAREYLEIIENAARAAGNTVARLRRFYRQETGPDAIGPVEVATLIREASAITRARWADMAQERGVVVDLRMDLPAELPAIDGVASEIIEALINLILNAVDAMPEGGTLRLRAHAFHRTPGDAAGVCIEIADTGVGMEEETRRRCLEPFFTTKGNGGAGIGLAIVSGILQRHDAEIAIESEPGAGTTMRLLFPPPRLRPKPTPEKAVPHVLPEMKILVADDDARVLRALRVALESEGHRPVCAAGGEVALRVFQAALDAGDPFDAVLTDLGMPHVDGRKVAAAVKAASPGTSVILLTGWGQDVLVEGAFPSGVDRLLAKPVAPEELSDALAACRPRAAQQRLPQACARRSLAGFAVHEVA